MLVPVWDADLSPRVEINTAQLLRIAFVQGYQKPFLEGVEKRVQQYYDVRGGRDRCSPQLQLCNVRKFGVIKDLCSHSIQHALTLLKGGKTSNLVVFSSVSEMLARSGDRGSVKQLEGVESTIEDFCSFSDPSLDVVKELERGLDMIAGKLLALLMQYTEPIKQDGKYADLSMCQSFFSNLRGSIAGQRMRMFSLSDASVMLSVRELYVELMRLVEVERADGATQERLQVIAGLLSAMSGVCARATQASRASVDDRFKTDLQTVRQVKELEAQLKGHVNLDERVSESFLIPLFHRLAMTPAIRSGDSIEKLCGATEAYLLALGDSVEDSLPVCHSLCTFFATERSAPRKQEDDDRVSTLIKNIREREASISGARGPRTSNRNIPTKQNAMVLEMVGASLAGLLSDLVFVTVNGRQESIRIDFHIQRGPRETVATASLPLNTPGLGDDYVDFAMKKYIDRVRERQRLSMRMDVFRLVFQKSFIPCMTVVVPGQAPPIRFMHEILRRDNNHWIACDELDMQLAQKDLETQLQERFERLSGDEELVAILTAYNDGNLLKTKPELFTEVLVTAAECFLALNASSNNALSFDSESDFGQSVDWERLVKALAGPVCPDWYNETMIGEYLGSVIADGRAKPRRYVVYKHSLEQLGVRTWNILQEAKKRLYNWSGGATPGVEAWRILLAETWSRQWRQDFKLYLELTDINIFRLRSDTTRKLAAGVKIPEWILQGGESSE